MQYVSATRIMLTLIAVIIAKVSGGREPPDSFVNQNEPRALATGPRPKQPASDPVLELISRTVFATGEVCPREHAVYVHPRGSEMRTRGAWSDNHGMTWKPESSTPDFDSNLRKGFRRSVHPPFMDPVEDRLLTMVLALDVPDLDPNIVEPAIGENEYYLRYRVSIDGGKSNLFDDRVIQDGEGFTERHPIDGVFLGKSGYYLGDVGSMPIRTRTGKILVPIQVQHLDEKGEPALPGGGFTHHYTRMLIGTWIDGHKIRWDVSEKIEGDPDRTTRGLFEPTLAELPDGRIICIMRSSNGHNRDPDHQWKSYKWISFSSDEGKTWSKPEPWKYQDGSELFSPSSMSQLLRYSDGRIFWLGNLNEKNCQANNPRYPLVIGQIDPQTARLIKETVIALDTLQPEDQKRGLNLSHWLAYEHRETGQIHVPIRRWDTPYETFQGAEYIVRVK